MGWEASRYRNFPSLQLHFQDQTVTGYIDTLVSDNILSLEAYERLDPDHKAPREPAPEAFQTAAGPTKGCFRVTLPFTIQDHSFTQRFTVIPTLPTNMDLLLGVPFTFEEQVGVQILETAEDQRSIQLNFRKRDFHIDQHGAGVDTVARSLLFSTTEPAEQDQQLRMGIYLPRPPPDPTPEEDTSSSPMALTKKQEQSLQQLLSKYGDIQKEKLPGVPPERENIKEVVQVLRDENTPPTYRPPIRQGPAETEAMRKAIADMVDQGFLLPADAGGWGSPAFMVSKVNSKGEHTGFRAVFDLRSVNSLCSTYGYTLPRISDLLRKAAGGRIFSSMDLTQGFYQMRLSKKTQPLSTISTPFGHFVFTVPPMGMASVPGHFQEMVDQVFSCLSSFLSVYIDDILIYSATFDEHLTHLEDTFRTLRENQLYINPVKCHFCMRRLHFLGFSLSHKKIGMLPKHTSTILEDTKPTTAGALSTWLGTLNYYRAFVPQFATLATPLYMHAATSKTKRNKALHWTDNMLQAHRALCDQIARQRELFMFDPKLPSRIKTDAASGIGLGGVLEQNYAGTEHEQYDCTAHCDEHGPRSTWHPVEFYSRRLIPAETNYRTHELELLAIVECTAQWQHLLSGTEFTILTDNVAVCYYSTKSLSKLSPREIRWLTKLAHFSPLNIQHIKGTHNVIADNLSRNPENSKDPLIILDLFSGSPSMLRSIEKLWDAGHLQTSSIRYEAIERDEHSRAAIAAVHSKLVKRGIPLSCDPFVIGDQCCHGVDNLASMLPNPSSHHLRKFLHSCHLVIAGPPCQGVSAAGKNEGMKHKEDGWGYLMNIHAHLHPNTSFIYENVPGLLRPVHQDLLQLLSSKFGKPVQLEAPGPQKRQRIFFSNHDLSQATELQDMETWGLAQTWQQALDKAAQHNKHAPAKAPLDASGKPMRKCPTIMVATDTHSVRSGAALVTDGNDTCSRTMNQTERECCVGFEPGDTGTSCVHAQRMTGNAIPVALTTCLVLTVINNMQTAQSTTCKQTAPQKTVLTTVKEKPVLSREITAYDRASDPETHQAPTPLQLLVTTTADEGSTANDINKDINSSGTLGLTPLQSRMASIHADYGHPSAQKTAFLLASREHRKVTAADMACAKLLVSTCSFCQRHKTFRTNPVYRKRQLPLPLELTPFHEVEVDECTGLHTDHRSGADAFLSIVDRFTKFTITVPIRTNHAGTNSNHPVTTSEDCALILFQIFTIVGFPDVIRVDSGTRFMGAFKALCTARRIKVATCTPHRHQQNGLVERTHGLILRAIRGLETEHAQLHGYLDPANWVEALHEATITVNNCGRLSLSNFSPSEMLFGRELPARGPAEDSANKKLKAAWAAWHELCREIVRRHHSQTQGNLDLSDLPQEPDYLPGQEVLFHPGDLGDYSHKMASKWVPATIVSTAKRTPASVPKLRVQVGTKQYSTGPERLQPYLTPLTGPDNDWSTPDAVLADALEHHRQRSGSSAKAFDIDLCASKECHQAPTWSLDAMGLLSSSDPASLPSKLVWCCPPWTPTADAERLLNRILAALRDRSATKNVYIWLPQALYTKVQHQVRAIKQYNQRRMHQLFQNRPPATTAYLCQPLQRSLDGRSVHEISWWDESCSHCGQDSDKGPDGEANDELVMCDRCPRVYHNACIRELGLSPPQPDKPWVCGQCDAPPQVKHYLVLLPSSSGKQLRAWVQLHDGTLATRSLLPADYDQVRAYAKTWSVAWRPSETKKSRDLMNALGIPATAETTAGTSLQLIPYRLRDLPTPELAQLQQNRGTRRSKDLQPLWLKLMS